MCIYTKEKIEKQKSDRLNEETYNNQGILMKIIEYNNSKDIVVEFHDDNKTKVHSTYNNFKKGSIKNPFVESGKSRLHQEKYNNQGCLMKIVEYNNSSDIIVEFQDEYRAKVHTRYYTFLYGNINNPYHKGVFGVGMIGEKYSSRVDGEITKEYNAWKRMLTRCFDKKYKERHPTYKNASCCNEWLLYDNFYEWLHDQENFDKWLDGNLWAVDKDILIKGNKIYSPKTCCLVPNNVNSLFIKKDMLRGAFPIGVYKKGNKYVSHCKNPLTGKQEILGEYNTPEQAFQVYKDYKEDIIKQVAQIEFSNGNITRKCYDAMMSYVVDITD